jgi:hypothetical protein
VRAEQVMDIRKRHFFEKEFQKIFIVGAAEPQTKVRPAIATCDSYL